MIDWPWIYGTRGMIKCGECIIWLFRFFFVILISFFYFVLQLVEIQEEEEVL